MVLVRGLRGLAAFSAVVLTVLVGTARAEEQRLLIELNQLEDTQAGCRGSMVFTNLLGVTLDELAIEVAVFDFGGQIRNLWLLPLEHLPSDRIRVRQYLFQEGSCRGIGHVLFNDVVTCAGDGLDPARCFELIEVTSRIHVPFVSTAEHGG